MKRSEINAYIREAIEFFDKHQFKLPPFAHWTPEDWQQKGEEVREIVERQLGWDLTDFATGDYLNEGLLLFTVRNGLPENLKTLKGKTYAEKIMIVKEKQVTPWHYHWSKMEDIINRGGGDLVIVLANADEKGNKLDTEVVVMTDGVERRIAPDTELVLQPGESITLTQELYHAFWARGGTVLCGEVSQVNDDHCDNRFHKELGRFPEIEEDEPPLRLLVGDYPKYYQPKK